ncbi:hypothetical protein [Arthrobacter sp. RAF14]|uniref:hypothetical protein n=1 Tax=Arthrobacter sp. RAF14 TaxID=3233051 RepID=UPI003F8FAA7D
MTSTLIGWLILAGAIGLMVLWGLVDFILYLVREAHAQQVWDEANKAADRLHARHREALHQMHDSAE